ncbi:MAG: hypothetical protein I3273_04675 [Candidatus Moeniiplasma glomeromycotorum]|nr:hypothetical protein [Candidatus Moeniiplasma glomeromycotorum]
MEYSLITFEENRKIVKNYSNPLELEIAKRKKLEKEGIGVFFVINVINHLASKIKKRRII